MKQKSLAKNPTVSTHQPNNHHGDFCETILVQFVVSDRLFLINRCTEAGLRLKASGPVRNYIQGKESPETLSFIL